MQAKVRPTVSQTRMMKGWVELPMLHQQMVLYTCGNTVYGSNSHLQRFMLRVFSVRVCFKVLIVC